MTAHYKEPILLIEFDEKKSFNLEVRLKSPRRQRSVTHVVLFPRADLH